MFHFFGPSRLTFQQAPANPELQQAPPPAEAGKEVAPPAPETGKEALPASADAVSTEYKDKAKQQLAAANNKLDVFANIKGDTPPMHAA